MAQQVPDNYYSDYRRLIAGLCSGCVLQLTCIHNCRRLRNLYHLVDEYETLKTAYSKVCGELTLGSQYFMGNTAEEVEDIFKNYAKKG